MQLGSDDFLFALQELAARRNGLEDLVGLLEASGSSLEVFVDPNSEGGYFLISGWVCLKYSRYLPILLLSFVSVATVIVPLMVLMLLMASFSCLMYLAFSF